MSRPSEWESIYAFEGVLARNETVIAIHEALPQFAREYVYPFIAGSQTLEQMDKHLDFFRTHLRHSTSYAGNHPRRAENKYPREVIAAAEDHILDTGLYPRIFSSRMQTTPEAPTLTGLSQFPRLISDYLRLDDETYRSIMDGTIDSKRPIKHERLVRDMDQLAVQNTARLMIGVQSARAYRERLQLLIDQLGEETKKFNKRASGHNSVRNDFKAQWERYVEEQVRKLYLSELFGKAYQSKAEEA